MSFNREAFEAEAELMYREMTEFFSDEAFEEEEEDTKSIAEKTGNTYEFTDHETYITEDVEKEWVPYTGPQGGTGWRSTVTQTTRYQEDKPTDSQAPNLDEVTMEDVERSDIQQTQVWQEIEDISDFDVGQRVSWYDPENDYMWEGFVEEISEDEIIIETNSERRLTVTVNNGEPEGTVRRQQIVHMGYGPAASNDTYIPEDEPATEPQIALEAIRSAASTEHFDDIDPLVNFYAYMDERGEDMSVVDDSIEYALMQHPYLSPEDAEEIKEEAGIQQEEVSEEEMQEEQEQVRATPVIAASAIVEPAYQSDSVFEKFIGGSYHRRRKVRERGAQLTDGCIQCLSDAHREQVWPDEITKSMTWEGDDDVTKETQEWVNTVLEMEDPMWDEYEKVPMAAALTVKQELKDSLTQRHGWSINSIQERLRDEFPQMEKYERVRIARQEVAGVLNKSKMAAIQARGDNPLVRWVGPGDADSTELCKSIEEKTQDGVPLPELVDILVEYAEEYGGTPHRAKQGVPHIQCRYTVEIVNNSV